MTTACPEAGRYECEKKKKVLRMTPLTTARPGGQRPGKNEKSPKMRVGLVGRSDDIKRRHRVLNTLCKYHVLV